MRARKPHREAWHETARGYELSTAVPTDADAAAIIVRDQVTTTTMPSHLYHDGFGKLVAAGWLPPRPSAAIARRHTTAWQTSSAIAASSRPNRTAMDLTMSWPAVSMRRDHPTQPEPDARAPACASYMLFWSASERRQAQRAVGRWPVRPRRALPVELPVTVWAIGITRGADHHAGAPPHPTRPSFNSFYARAPVRVPILLWSASAVAGTESVRRVPAV